MTRIIRWSVTLVDLVGHKHVDEIEVEDDANDLEIETAVHEAVMEVVDYVWEEVKP